ncbi:MAG: TonB-dependent receptor [Gammaproteobacteria bacterium]|nr:TonB-dependent receptor [Gammaproteobacteria bacterium]
MKKINSGFLLFASLIFSQSTFAEAIQLHIRAQGSGDEVPEAVIVNQASEAYEKSDSEGKAQLTDITFPLKIKVLASGYETKIVSIEHIEKSRDIFLEPVSVDAQTIEIVAERIPEKTSKVILNNTEIRKVAGTRGDPLGVVYSMPGITYSGPQIYVRGSSTDDSGVWVNRIPVQYIFHWADISGNLSTINPDLLSNFNIFLGGFPVEYPNFLGGFLDVELRKPKNDRFHHKYRVGLNESAFMFEGPIGGKDSKSSYYLTGRKSYLDVVLTPEVLNKLQGADETNKKTQILQVPQYYDMQAGWHYKLPRGSIETLFMAAGDAFGIKVRGDREKNTNPDVLGKISASVDYKTLGLNWQQLWGAGWRSISTASITNNAQSRTIGQDATGQPYFVDTNSMEYGMQPELQYQHNQYSWYLGTEFRYINIPINIYVGNEDAENETAQTSNFSTRQKFRIDTRVRAGSIAPYLKYRHHFENGLTTTLGLRHTYIKGSGGIEMQALNPRVAFEYELNPTTTLLANWGQYVQTPKDSYLLKDFGNPALGFTRAEHRILGVKHKFNPLWNILVEAYHKPITDLVFSIPGQQPPDNYKNTGEGEAYGVDFLVKREYAQRRMGWLSYSISHSTRTDTLTGETYTFAGDRPHSLTLLWGQPLPGSWKKWDWSIRFHISSGKPYTPVVGRQIWCRDTNTLCTDQSTAPADVLNNDNLFWVPVTAEKNSKRLPFNYKVDIRFERPILFNTWKMTFYADLQNVTFAKNIQAYDYGKYYEKTDNPDEITGLSFLLPFLGIEAEF